jgi:hypothetical protein
MSGLVTNDARLRQQQQPPAAATCCTVWASHCQLYDAWHAWLRSMFQVAQKVEAAIKEAEETCKDSDTQHCAAA